MQELIYPQIIVSDEALLENGFIKSGKEKYKKLVVAFSKELFDRSIMLCDAGNLGGEREVTQDYVVKASQIYLFFGVISILYGLFYNEIKYIMYNNPAQLIAIVLGLVMVVLSLFILLREKNRECNIHSQDK